MPLKPRKRRLKRTRRPYPSRLTLSPDWQIWVAENLLRGVAPASLAASLAAQGLDAERAAIEVNDLAASPILSAAARALSARAEARRQFELVASVRRTLLNTTSDPTSVERRSGLSGDEFFERYYCQGAPVILTDIVPAWPAAERWTPGYLKEKYGGAPVRFTEGRDADPLYDQNTEAHTITSSLAEYIDRITAAGETNDLYMVANNRNLEREPLAGLLDDVFVPEAYLAPARARGSSCLWLGPAGTVTPLHHDTTNILFCQVHGRKRFRIISPFETSVLSTLEGVYSPIDPEKPDFDRFPSFKSVLIKDVVLAPGEALFIPVGAFHHVRALDLSISISFTNFKRPNRFEWYLPGAIR